MCGKCRVVLLCYNAVMLSSSNLKWNVYQIFNLWTKQTYMRYGALVWVYSQLIL